MIINGERVLTIDYGREDAYFSMRGCENCNSGLGCEVYDVQCNTSLGIDDEDVPDHYTVRLCTECIYTFHYGDELPDIDGCMDVYGIFGEPGHKLGLRI